MSSAAVVSNTSALTLDDLVASSPDVLADLYAGGDVPVLSAVSGAPHGRMLAVDGFGSGRRQRMIAGFAARPSFPWRGKDFAHTDADRGSGINRVKLVLLRRLYGFETEIASSVVDGKPCFHLNYDLPRNPWFIRAIRDEIREVAPGLYLGPALLRTGGDYKRVLHFAIDHSRSGV
jgi:hypothetical protein